MHHLRGGPCKVKDCPNQVHSKELCRKHYNQVWKHGQIMPDRKPTTVFKDNMALQLDRLQVMYKNMVNIDRRIKLRKEIKILETQMSSNE